MTINRGYLIVFILTCFFNFSLYIYLFPNTQNHVQVITPVVVHNSTTSWHDKKVDNFKQMLNDYFVYHQKVMRQYDPDAKFSVCVTNAGWGKSTKIHILNLLLRKQISTCALMCAVFHHCQPCCCVKTRHCILHK